LYGTLLYLLQCDTKLISVLVRISSPSEMDSLLHTVMFTLFGDQYDAREEYLLLSMFQVTEFLREFILSFGQTQLGLISKTQT
jgi:hypothetical protein